MNIRNCSACGCNHNDIKIIEDRVFEQSKFFKCPFTDKLVFIREKENGEKEMEKEKKDYKQLNEELKKKLDKFENEIFDLKKEIKANNIYVEKANNITKENSLLKNEVQLLKNEVSQKENKIYDLVCENENLIAVKIDIEKYKSVVKMLLGDE